MSADDVIYWLWCPVCGEPSSVDSRGVTYPGVRAGFDVDGMPDDVADLWEEARRCFSVGGYAATELLCRKLLMHIAVDKGAAENETFAAYMSFLETEQYVSPVMRSWVDLIRKHGNQQTHEIDRPTEARSAGTLAFTGELLRVMYEMPHLARIHTAAVADEEAGTAN